MMSILRVAIIFVLTLGFVSEGHAHRFQSDPSANASPERFNLEFRVGVYEPQLSGTVFESVFGDDQGPSLGVEWGTHIYRIPYVGPVGLSVGFNRIGYSANAFVQGSTTERSSEQTTLTLWPIHALGFLRVDALAREANIPLVVTGKIGWDVVLWSTETGEVEEGSGYSQGLRWAAQVALELDFLEPRAARMLDQEWGINHAYLFFEYYGSGATGDLDLSATTWAAGLGFQF